MHVHVYEQIRESTCVCVYMCVCVNVDYLLNDAVLNVDICFLGEIIIHYLSSLDEDTHGPHVGSHSPTRETKKPKGHLTSISQLLVSADA